MIKFSQNNFVTALIKMVYLKIEDHWNIEESAIRSCDPIPANQIHLFATLGIIFGT